MDFCASTLTSKGQTTIPVEIRKMLGLKTNMKIFWVSLRPGEVSLVAAPASTKKGNWTKKMCGLLSDKKYDGVAWLLEEKKKSNWSWYDNF